LRTVTSSFVKWKARNKTTGVWAPPPVAAIDPLAADGSTTNTVATASASHVAAAARLNPP
jgi:hypothetical protein